MRIPPLLFSMTLIVAVGIGPLHAQVGYLRIQTHLPGEPDTKERGVLRASISTSGGSQELDSYALTPGVYVLTRVETLIGNCYASTHDVPFTIVAGQWTVVKTQVEFGDCFYQANPRTEQGGEGKVTATSPVLTIPPVDCGLTRTGDNDWRIVDFSSCRGVAPFGSSTFIQQHALAGSSLFAHSGLADDSVTLVVDTTNAIPLELAQIFLAQEFDDTAETGQVSDVSVSRLSSSLQGRLMRSTFRVTNHGPGHALQVEPVFNFNGNAPDVGGSRLFLVEPSLGNCRTDNHCQVPDLPPGESADFTLVAWAVPNSTSEPFADPRCLLFVAALSNPDPDPGNNSVDCVADSVAVTVTAGSGNSTPVTVSSGSATVPVLRFRLTPATTFSLTDITLSASGSGNESVDVSDVKLYLDANGNGQVDGSDMQLAHGTYPENDGTVKLTITPPYGVTGPTYFVVTYDFSVSVANRIGFGIGLGLLGLISIGRAGQRRRRWLPIGLGMVLVLGLTRCGGDSGGPSGGGNPTYRATLTGLSADGAEVPGVSLPGATITVSR